MNCAMASYMSSADAMGLGINAFATIKHSALKNEK